MPGKSDIVLPCLYGPLVVPGLGPILLGLTEPGETARGPVVSTSN